MIKPLRYFSLHLTKSLAFVSSAQRVSLSSWGLVFLAVQVFWAIAAPAVLAQDKTSEQAKPTLGEVIAAVPRSSPLGQAEAAEEQTIIFVGDQNYPPYEYLENGRPKGASADLVRAIGKVVGRPVELRLMKWSEAQESVLEGRSDVLTVFGKNEERERLYDFSKPTFIVSFSLFVPLDALGSFDIQRLSGRRLGVTKGGWPRKYLETNQPGASLVVIDNYEDGFRQLLRGNLDAVAANTWSGYFTLRRMAISSVGTTPEPLKSVVASMAVRKGNRELLTQIDKALALLKSTGEFDKIIDRWSGRQIVLVERGQVWAVYSVGVLALVVLVSLALFLFVGKSKRMALAREVTERKRAEQEIAEKSALLETTFESISQGISVFDADLKLVAFNRRYADLWGYPPGFIRLGMPCEEVVRFKAERGDYGSGDVERKVRERLRAHRAGEASESEFALPNGKVIYFSRNPLPGGGSVTTYTDITERKRAEEALSKSEERLRTILDNAIDGIITIDEHGIVETFNHAAERTFGYTAEEVIGHNVNMLMAEPERTEHDGYIRSYLETGEVKIIGKGREVTGRRKDGTTFPLSLGIAEVGQGERRMFIGTLHDLTQQKRIEAQLIQAQRLEALGWLAGGIAHDFNNILLPIITITEVCRDDLSPDGELSGHLEKVLLAAQRGRALVDQILKFSRRQPMERRSVDLREAIEEALKLARTTVPSMIEIRSHFDAAVGKVLADSNQIHEVVVNLITNAAHAIGTKKGIIEVALHDEVRISGSADGVSDDLEPGTYACLMISDNGAGMEEETLAHIFDPFFTTKPFGEGTGMGLAVVHGIVTGHGGAIAVSSQPHIGTTFEIYLPVIEMAATAPSDVEATDESN